MHESHSDHSGLPAWCYDEGLLPPLYRVVHQIVTNNGAIDTYLLYPVLLSSGVARNVLGHIWGLVNKTLPGQLTRPELNAALALVALVQSGNKFNGVEVLRRFQQPPIPLLQHPALCLPQQRAVFPLVIEQTTAKPMPQAMQKWTGVNSHAEQADEFSDFLSAPAPSFVISSNKTTLDAPNSSRDPLPANNPSSVKVNPTVGSRLANYGFSTQVQSVPISNQSTPTIGHELIQNSLETSHLPAPVSAAHLGPKTPSSSGSNLVNLENDDFTDFLKASPVQSSHSTVTHQSSISNADKYAVFRSLGPDIPDSFKQDSQLNNNTFENKYDAFRTIATTPETTLLDEPVKDDEFGDFLSVSMPLPTSCQPPSLSTSLVMDNPGLSANIGNNIKWRTSGEIKNDTRNSLMSPEFQLSLFQSALTSSVPSQVVSTSVTEATSVKIQPQDDDEFGDFLSPGDVTVDDVFSSAGHSIKSKDTISVESQSVSSFDLGTNDGLTLGSGLSREGSIPSLDFRVEEDKDTQFALMSNGSNNMKPMETCLSPALNTKSNSVLPLVDRYSCVRNEDDSCSDLEKNVAEWTKCLDSCYQLIKGASDILAAIESEEIREEVVNADEGRDYLKNVIEIYRLACRIRLSIRTSAFESESIQKTLYKIESAWRHLASYISSSNLVPTADDLDYTYYLLPQEPANNLHACGICLLNVDSSGKIPYQSPPPLDSNKLFYGGRQYHTTCANFWLNCVNSLLPTLTLQKQLL